MVTALARAARPLALTLGLTLPAYAAAQSLRPGLLVGRVLDAEGAAVEGATLRASRGTQTVLAYSDDDGSFRLSALAAGQWTLSIRRLGYTAARFDITMPEAGLRRDFGLIAVSRALDPVLIAERWTGIRGLVRDARLLTPLAGATIRVLGGDASVSSDIDGNFSLPLPSGREFLLRVERAGYATQLVSASVPADGYVELEVGLDTVLKAPKDYWVWRDLDQRLKYATPRAGLIHRDELSRTGATSLADALPYTGSVARLGLRISNDACLYVNGEPRPGYPVSSILAGNVEFVEMYPAGSDLTRTLTMKWPPGGTCGNGVAPAAAQRSSNQVRFVSVWLRAP